MDTLNASIAKATAINEIEINSLILLNYYLSYASPITFMEMFFIKGIIFINDKINTYNSNEKEIFFIFKDKNDGESLFKFINAKTRTCNKYKNE